jgi:hypothetical protein
MGLWEFTDMTLTEIAAWTALALAVVLGVLLVVQTSRLGRIERQYKSLMKGSTAGGLTMSLGEVVSAQADRLETVRADLDALNNRVGAMDVLVNRSVQHVAVVRFNPFADTGGDQSFALALLDRKGDGVVISSLHTRTMTRFYSKPIKGGTSALSLSDEEVQAVQQAMGTAVRTA